MSSQSPAPLASLPVATVRWPWSAAWPYPLQKRLELELAPRWTIRKSLQAVTVDGELTDWTDAAPFTLDAMPFIDQAVPGKRALWAGPNDLSASWSMKWDNQALYLAAVVRDSEHIQQEVPAMMWSQDMLQVALYDDSTKPIARYEYGFGLYLNTDKNPFAVVNYGASVPPTAQTPPVRYKGRCDDGVCIYEVAIPWERLAPVAPAPGKSFRFSFTVGDADPQPGKGYNYLAWTPGIAYGKNPFDMAVITLGN